MLDAISKSSAALTETKDAALRTIAHDEAADNSKTSEGVISQESTHQAGGVQSVAQGATATPAATTAAPITTAQQEQKDLNTAEAQGLTTDYDVDYPDSDYDPFDGGDETGYAGFYSKASAAASNGVQIADTYNPIAAKQSKYPGLNRSIINNYSGQQTPAVLMRSEVSPVPKEPSVNRAFDGFGMTYTLLSKALL